MGGHGSYVWSAYAVFIAMIGLLVYLPIRRHRTVLKRLEQQDALSRQRAQSE